MYMAYSKDGKRDVQQGAINCLTASDVCGQLYTSSAYNNNENFACSRHVRRLPELNWAA